MRKRLGPFLIGATLLATASIGAAQTPEVRQYAECRSEPTGGDVQAAKGAFQAGQASFNEADYERAIIYWEDAFRRDCTAVALLLNLARAYELNGNKHQAIEALQTYLARRTDNSQDDQITRRIDVLNQQIEKERAAAAASPTQPPPAVEQAEPPPPSPSAPPPASGRELNLVHWVGPAVLGGVGLMVAVVGGLTIVAGGNDVDDAEKACPTRMNCPAGITQLGNDGRSKQTTGGVVSIAGVAMLAGAGIWFFVAPRYKDDITAIGQRERAGGSRLSLSPMLSPNYSGLSLAGSF